MHCTLSIHYTVNITNVKNSDMHGAHAMHAPAEGWDDETLSDSATGATVKEAEGQKAHEKSTPLKSRRISTPLVHPMEVVQWEEIDMYILMLLRGILILSPGQLPHYSVAQYRRRRSVFCHMIAPPFPTPISPQSRE